MIAVDSSVWIDLFADRQTIETAVLERLVIANERIVVGDLILAEVLQGTTGPKNFKRTLDRLNEFDQFTVASPSVAIAAARNYQTLRTRGITVRKTIDTLLATRCILARTPLLYSDRDFDPFVEHLGLRSALELDPGVN